MTMLQMSVYVKLFRPAHSPKPLISTVANALPDDGTVTIMVIPDLTYQNAYRFVGKTYAERRPEQPSNPTELTLF